MPFVALVLIFVFIASPAAALLIVLVAGAINYFLGGPDTSESSKYQPQTEQTLDEALRKLRTKLDKDNPKPEQPRYNPFIDELPTTNTVNPIIEWGNMSMSAQEKKAHLNSTKWTPYAKPV